MPRLIKEAWERIGTPSHVLKWIEEGVSLQFEKEPSPCWLTNRVNGHRQETFVDGEISALLQSRAIKRVSRDQVHCVLPLRCVLKKRNSLHLVIDCHHINSQIRALKFSQEGI